MTELDWPEILLRLGTATLAGGAIGLNRDLHGKPIGLKTLGIVGLSTATVVLLAVQFSEPGKITDAASRDPGHSDRDRLPRGRRHRPRERTVSRPGPDQRAACTFLAACLGIACGAGQWKIIAAALALALVLLTIGRRIERGLHRMLGGKDETPPKPHSEDVT